MSESIGRYEVVRRLAQGGMAEVYLAVQRAPGGFQKQVAIKQLLPELAEDPNLVERFLYEGKLVATLTHANICQVFDSGIEQGRHFLVMEYVEGQTLARILRRARNLGRAVPPPLAAYAVARAAEALAYVHDKLGPDGRALKVVHRDVSPQNIMVTYQGQVKVLDFGIARSADRPFRTRTGEVHGKLHYMAPEQFLGEALDGRSDVYSLGVVLYEAIAGRTLFSTESEGAWVLALRHQRMPSFRELPGVSPALAEVGDAAMAKARAERLDSASTLALRLDACVGRLGAEAMAQLGELVRELFADELKGPLPQSTSFPASTSTREPSQEPTLVDPGSKKRTQRLTVALVAKKRRPALVAGGAAVVVAIALGGGIAMHARTRKAPPTAVVHAAPEKPVVVEVAPAPEKPAPVATPEPTPTAPIVPTHRARHLEKKTVSHARPAAAAPQPPGKLTLDSIPWADVYLDGKKLGTTPLVEVELPAGTQHLRLLNRGAKIDRFVDVRIVPNQLIQQRVSF